MADFCYECNHPERFHINDWSAYRGIPPTDVPCRADYGQCGCEQFVPEPEERHERTAD